ncbi:MAG: integrin alpha [Chloroflexota bacterium]
MYRRYTYLTILIALVVFLVALAPAGRVTATVPAGPSTTPDWTAESDQAAAAYGWSVSSAGDVNGDGYDDLLVGAYDYDSGNLDEGRVFVYHGSASGLSLTASWTAESDLTKAAYGWSASTAGDVNSDGYDDVIVGAWLVDDPDRDEGKAYVYYGSAGGLSPTADWTIGGDQIGAHLGAAVSAAGDVNGDGYDDVIIGAHLYDNDLAEEGRAYIYYGSAGGLAPTANWYAEGDQEQAQLGYAVGAAGDVNNDGYDDVIVGAPLYDNGQANEGRALVYYGSATGPSATANWAVESNQIEAQMGAAVGPAGDVNGDGYGDVIVGAPRYDHGQANEGLGFVFLGSASGLGVRPAWVGEGDQANAAFGASLASAGDVNGDGYADVIVGAYFLNHPERDEGVALLYYGSAAGLSRSPNWRTESDNVDAFYGYSVNTAGDVNGDGYADVVIGAPFFDNGELDEGRTYVYHGAP